MPTNPQYVALLRPLWAQAAEQELGLAIPTDNVRKLQTLLYEARKGGPEEWQGLMLCMPNGGKEVWLVKKTVDVDA